MEMSKSLQNDLINKFIKTYCALHLFKNSVISKKINSNALIKSSLHVCLIKDFLFPWKNQ